MRRVPVGVLAEFDERGAIRPVSVRWEDGHVYEVERVLDVRRAATARYTLSILGYEAYLYRNGDRWFMESRD